MSTQEVLSSSETMELFQKYVIPNYRRHPVCLVRGEGSGAPLERTGLDTVAASRLWIEDHAGAPFFYFLHLFEPHTPYEPPEPFRSRYPSAYDGEIAAADAAVGEFLDVLKRVGVYEKAIVVLVMGFAILAMV